MLVNTINACFFANGPESLSSTFEELVTSLAIEIFKESLTLVDNIKFLYLLLKSDISIMRYLALKFVIFVVVCSGCLKLIIRKAPVSFLYTAHCFSTYLLTRRRR